MRNLIATLLAVSMVLGGIPLAVTMLDEDPTADGPEPSVGRGEGGAGSASDARASDQADTPSTGAEARTAGPTPPKPQLQPPKPGASPMEMTENLLGPAPEGLREVDPDLSLAEAMRQHPAYPDEVPATADLAGTPMGNALSRLIQAHGVLTEVLDASSNGDEVARELVPYAASQLATEAQRAAPVFNTYSDILDLESRSELRLDGTAEPVSETASLQAELDRLYGSMGLPRVPAVANAGEPAELAKIVHATADVVETSNQARQSLTVADGIQADLDRVDRALSDGKLTPAEARMVAEVATMVHDTTTAPIQARLDALDTLYATVEHVVPTMTAPASHNPQHQATGTVQDTANETQETVEGGADDAQNTTEDVRNQTQTLVNDTTGQARDLINETIQPVEEEMRDNFVDPLGAIVILGEGDDRVENNGTPVPIDVGGTAVGSLFPRSPLLVVDRGGDEVYVGLPRSETASDTANTTKDPIVSDERLGVDGERTIESLPEGGGLAGAFVGFAKTLGLITYQVSEAVVEGGTSFEVAITADTPAQVVVDLDGDDRYIGNKGAAYASGGGTAAVYDRQGDDTYDVDRGIGLLAEDGLAIVKDMTGDDTYRAERGIGSVIQPFTVEDQGLSFDDRFRLLLGGLGGLIDHEGNDTYDAEEVGVGIGFYETTLQGLPNAFPVTLDLAGWSAGLQPHVFESIKPEPQAETEHDGGAYVRAWFQNPVSTSRPGTIIIGGDDSGVQFDHRWANQAFAVDRNYDTNLTGPTEGRVEVQDHNVTTRPVQLTFLYFELPLGIPLDADLHNGLVVNLDDTSDVYEPEHPLILIDAGNATDTYVNASARQSIGQDLLTGNDYPAPLFVLDTRGDDRWIGEIGSLNTTALENEFTGDGHAQLPSASSVLVDSAGDDLYDGNVSQIGLNYTGRPTTFTTLVHDARGSDTIRGGTVGGVLVDTSSTQGIGTGKQIGHSVNSLLLMGVEDPETERDTITTGGGSLGSVYVDHVDTSENAFVSELSRLKAGTVNAAPADYLVGNHSLGSVRWCKSHEGFVDENPALSTCPQMGNSGGLDGSLDYEGEGSPIAGLFVGSTGADSYTVEDSRGLGHVTVDPAWGCDVSDNLGPEVHVPQITTRFVDVSGADSYQILDPTDDLPPWRNDDSWRPYECGGVVSSSYETTTRKATSNAFGLIDPNEAIQSSLGPSFDLLADTTEDTIVIVSDTTGQLSETGDEQATRVNQTGKTAAAQIRTVGGTEETVNETLASLNESLAEMITSDNVVLRTFDQSVMDLANLTAGASWTAANATRSTTDASVPDGAGTVPDTIRSTDETAGTTVLAISQNALDQLAALQRDVTEEADVREINTLGVDNLGQYALGVASVGAGETVEDTGLPLVRFEPPRMCVGPYAEEEGVTTSEQENETVLRGFQKDVCAMPGSESRFSQRGISTDERIVLTTRTRNTVPANLLGVANPCEVGSQEGQDLALEAKAENEPAGNPISHGTSGCWATLKVKPLMDRNPGPLWDRFAPNGTGWLDVLAGPVQCGLSDENGLVRCATDAFPVPYHVDGTNGRNDGRWLLPEGEYTYCMTFHGPLGVALGTESTMGCGTRAKLTIDRSDSLRERGPVDAFPESETSVPEGLMTWLEEHSDTLDDEAPGASRGLSVRAVSQRSGGSPQDVQVWGPLELEDHDGIVPLVCLDGTPYRGDLDEAESRWLGDLGTWVTRYPLDLWTGDGTELPPPESCDETAPAAQLTGTGAHEVETALYVRSGTEFDRLDLPDHVTKDTVVVDDARPFVDVGPLTGSLGVDQRTHGIGLGDVRAPEIGDVFTENDLSGRQTVHTELPIRVQDESPVAEVLFANQDDHVWEDGHIAVGDVNLTIEVDRERFGTFQLDYGGATYQARVSGLFDKMSPGEHQVRLQVRDEAGQTVPAEATVTFDDLDISDATIGFDEDSTTVTIPWLQGPQGDQPMAEITDVTVSVQPKPESSTRSESNPVMIFPDGSGDTVEVPCNAELDRLSVCDARLNLTGASQAPSGNWYRNLTLNLTLDYGSATENEPVAGVSYEEHLNHLVREAIVGAAEFDRPMGVDLASGLEVRDEAGNRATERVRELVIDLHRPDDLALPCGTNGASLITTDDEIDIQTFLPGGQEIQGLYVERKVDGDWVPIQWTERSELERVDRNCETDSDLPREWLSLPYEAVDAENGSQVLHKLRTVPVDAAGNHELPPSPFEFSVLFDQRTPALTATTTSVSPHEVTVSVASDEPIRVGDDPALVSPAGERIGPLNEPVGLDTRHEIPFAGLAPNTTYQLEISAEDRAGLTNVTSFDVRTARTLNVTLDRIPSVAADLTTMHWSAGALGPAEGGSPAVRAQLSAAQNGTACGQRNVDTYVDAPIEAPAPRNISLPITDCPAGNLTVELRLENGPVDDPLETVTLNATVFHDVLAPTPELVVDGVKEGTGWYTTPVSVKPSGFDDGGIAEATIVTEQGPVDQLAIDESGAHEVTVRVKDNAGRTQTETFRVPVDLARPQVQIISRDQLPTERSVITVQIEGADDASGLRSVRFMQADDTFSEWAPVVPGMQRHVDVRGLDVVLAEVRDRAGHVTQSILPVTSLADPPEVQDARIGAASPGSVQVDATLDREVPLEAVALHQGTVVARTLSDAARDHSMTLTGLTPGADVTVETRARLSDGRDVSLSALTETVHLPADEGPPTAPSSLEAQVLDDGTVRLTWDAARDDAGIDSYLVQRRTDGVVSGQWSVTDTHRLDDAPASTEHVYRVKAVDLSGRTGAWSSAVSVTPDVPTRILSYDVSPEVATAGSPVTFTVTAQASQAPDDAHLEIGDRRVPLVLEKGSQGRWVYRANLTLPTTDTFFPKGVKVHMGEKAFPAEGTFPGPVVKALEEGEVATTNQTPAPGLWLALLAGILAAVGRKRRWLR